MTPKHKNMLDYMLSKITALYEADASMAMRVIDTATKSAHRLHGRLTVPEDAERVEYAQDNGPTVEFTGRKLFGKDGEGYLTEMWTTLSGDWVLLRSTPHGHRAYIFTGEERTSQMVAKATGYAEWTSKLFKGMGWDKHLEVD